jgi:hypothetical protein
MKRILLIAFALLLYFQGHAQTLSFHSLKDVTIKDSITLDLPTQKGSLPDNVVFFKINDIPKNADLSIIVDDKNKGSAELTTDYKYIKVNGEDPTNTNPNINTSSEMKYSKDIQNSTSIILPIEIQTIKEKAKSAVFTIEVNNKGVLDKIYTIHINLNSAFNVVVPDNLTKMVIPDTAKWYLRVVTGGNFDFFSGPSIKNFAGDLTAFLPNVFHINKFVFGMDFGINNFHYFNVDSSHTVKDNYAYYINSKDFYTGDTTGKVVKSSANVNRKYDYNVWGIHLDPLIPLLQNDFAQLYLKIHIEELMTIETYTPTPAGSQSDTLTYGQYLNFRKANPSLSLPTPSPHPEVFYPYKQHTYYDMYWGIGLPVMFTIPKVASLYVSPSIGLAWIELADPQFDPDPIQRDVFEQIPNHATHETKLYLLNKFQFVTTVAPINIALGGEYRTVTNNMHYFSTYIGAAITLDKLPR